MDSSRAGTSPAASTCSRPSWRTTRWRSSISRPAGRRPGRRSLSHAVHAVLRGFQGLPGQLQRSAVGGINNPTNRNADTTSHLWGTELSGQARSAASRLDFGAAYLDSELGTFEDVSIHSALPPDNVVNLSGAEVPCTELHRQYRPRLCDSARRPLVDAARRRLVQRRDAGCALGLATRHDTGAHAGERTADAHTGLGPLVSRALGHQCRRQALRLRIQNNATLYYAAPPRQYGLRAKFNF